MTYAIIIITLVVLCGLCGWLLFSLIRRGKNQSSVLNSTLITLDVIVLVSLLFVLVVAVVCAITGPHCDHPSCPYHGTPADLPHAYVDSVETQQYI